MPRRKIEQDDQPAQPESTPINTPNNSDDDSSPLPPGELPPEPIEDPPDPVGQQPIDEGPKGPKLYV